MARGMNIPVTVTGRGGAKLLQGSEYTRQVIQVGLTPNTSRNPFQPGDGKDLGIDERVVFADEVQALALGRRSVTRFFARIREHGIAKLAPDGGLRISGAREELVARVAYVDLDADKADEVRSDLRTPRGV